MKGSRLGVTRAVLPRVNDLSRDRREGSTEVMHHGLFDGDEGCLGHLDVTEECGGFVNSVHAVGFSGQPHDSRVG